MRTYSAKLTILLLLVATAGCTPSLSLPHGGKPFAGSPRPPEQWKPLEGGVRFAEVTSVSRSRPDQRLWVYLPAGAKEASGLPSVLIAPAGSRGFHGMNLEEDDRAEHLPYASAGFAVVAFAIDGPLSDSPMDAETMAAIRAFQGAKGGILNARAAASYALNTLHVDPKRLYIAGHSSAATLALQAAQNDPRIAACIAYAPCSDLQARLSPALDMLNQVSPGFTDFVRAYSPRNRATDLKCPLFLFQATDDTNILPEETRAFARSVRRTNSRVSYVEVPHGGHFESMMDEGIPRAIAWLSKLSGAGSR